METLIEKCVMKTAIEFDLGDGKKILLSDDVVKQICDRIKVDMMLAHCAKGTFVMNNIMDSDVDKVRDLYRIVTEQKDMSAELKDQYYKAILEITIRQGGNPKDKIVMHHKEGEDLLLKDKKK